MIYVLLATILAALEVIYIKKAKAFGIVDTPNFRSSHRLSIVRGGGLIFPISIIFWAIFGEFVYPYFTIGIILISLVSFFDDIFVGISVGIRLFVQFLSVALILFGIFDGSVSVFVVVIWLVVTVGWINAFNFMDGINGITPLYSIVSLITFLFLNSEFDFVDRELIIFPLVGVLVFSWFNVRKKAVAFAGDIGSISIAFILAYLMIRLIVTTGNWHYLLFFSIYLLDSGFTVFQRVLWKQNIFAPHRTHFYQYLANEMKWPHLMVAFIYALLQLLVNISIIFLFPDFDNWALSFSIMLLIALLGFLIIARKRIEESVELPFEK